MNYPKNSHLSNRTPGRKRDQILSNALAESSSRFLQKFDFKKTKLGLDLGCRMGEITLLLKALLGQNGKMIGIDSTSINVSIAKERAALIKQSGIEFFQKEISAWREQRQYDFVYSRLLFNELSEPPKVMQQIFKSLKSGGWAMIEEMDLSNYQCYPNNYAFERFVELAMELKIQQGTNTAACNQLIPLFRNAGFRRIQVQVTQPVFLKNESKSIPSLSLENIANSLINEQLATASELHALLIELKSFEKRPNTLITLPSIYQAWAYKA